VRTCLLFVAAGALGAQSTASTYTPDINGNLVPGTAVVSADGVTTDLRQSINGREVPLEQVQEKVLSRDGNTTVTERIVRHFGVNGEVVQTDRIVTEATKTGEGASVMHSTTYRSDISGNMSEAERKTVETHQDGAATVTDTAIQKKDLDGSFGVAEKRTLTSEPTSNGKRESETVMLRDTNGNLYQAQRSSTVETKTGNQVVVNTAIYEPGVNGNLSLKRQQVSTSTSNPDGSSSQEVEIFGRTSDSMARAEGAPPALTEKRTIERQKGAGGAIVETQTVQLPSVNDPGRLDAARKVLETICRGECEKKNQP
jgi:hypothetical protein